MSTVAPQWSGAGAAAAAAAASDVTADMTDMEAHIQQTNDRLLCIQQVSIHRLVDDASHFQVLIDFCFCPRPPLKNGYLPDLKLKSSVLSVSL